MTEATEPTRRALGRLDEAWRHPWPARILQLLIVGTLVLGVARRNTELLVNAAGGLAVTVAPAVLERDWRLPLDTRLSLWLTGAVFLHVAGAVGLPGLPASFYSALPCWDHLTHVASASVVAGVGYAGLRAVEAHGDAVELPTGVTVLLTLVVVLAVGVYWELFEYAVGLMAGGGESPLSQYGIDDTLGDLAFDAVGGAVVAGLAWLRSAG